MCHVTHSISRCVYNVLLTLLQVSAFVGDGRYAGDGGWMLQKLWDCAPWQVSERDWERMKEREWERMRERKERERERENERERERENEREWERMNEREEREWEREREHARVRMRSIGRERERERESVLWKECGGSVGQRGFYWDNAYIFWENIGLFWETKRLFWENVLFGESLGLFWKESRALLREFKYIISEDVGLKGDTAYCIWSGISPISKLDRSSSSLRLFWQKRRREPDNRGKRRGKRDVEIEIGEWHFSNLKTRWII